IFSAGVIVSELLAGNAPFEGGAPVEVGYAVLRHEPSPPPGSAQIAHIVDRCLEKEPTGRYSTGGELLAALRDLPAVRSPVRLRMLRRRLSLFAVVGICAAIAGALYLKTRPALTPVARDRIAVLPVVVRGGAQYSYLRDGIPDVLGPSLAEAGLKRVNPMALLGALRDFPQELEPEAAADIARKFGAGLFLSGEVVEVKDRLQLHGELFDTTAPRAPLAEARA